MGCSNLTVTSQTADLKWTLLVDTSGSWGTIATYAAKVADLLSGVSIFGYTLDLSIITGFNIDHIEYGTDYIDVFIISKQSATTPSSTPRPMIVPAIIAVIVAALEALWPYITWLGYLFGIVFLGSKLISLADMVVQHEENNAERTQDKQRADCIKSYVDAGKTTEEAIQLCTISFPERKNTTDWAGMIIPAALILGIAYIFGSRNKS